MMTELRTLKQIREDDELTLEGFGAKIGYDVSTVQGYETGKPSEKYLRKVCAVFGITRTTIKVSTKRQAEDSATHEATVPYRIEPKINFKVFFAHDDTPALIGRLAAILGEQGATPEDRVTNGEIIFAEVKRRLLADAQAERESEISSNENDQRAERVVRAARAESRAEEKAPR